MHKVQITIRRARTYWSGEVIRPVLFVVFLLAVGGLFFVPLRKLMGVSLQHEQFSHIPLVAFVGAVLIYRERKEIFAKVASSRASTAISAVAAALSASLAFVAGRAPESEALALQICAFLLLLVSVFVFIWGLECLKKAAFPLGFLAFMVPLPDSLLQPVVRALQHGSAHAAEALFWLSGVPYFREDMIFLLPGLAIEVAEECSGIRSSLALLITTTLIARTFLRKSGSRLALIMAVVPVAMAKNGLRIVTLSILAIYVDPSFLRGLLHTQGGIIFFLIALAVIGLLVKLLRTIEKRKQLDSTTAAPASTAATA
jgi:exosortase